MLQQRNFQARHNGQLHSHEGVRLTVTPYQPRGGPRNILLKKCY
ncbi:hypothetical protein UUU_06670 [Klebsiella pneumoniae subsp. pneumoniae DSM 30104 = JCM 1662 = NBRC 14940]|nr:hypothetical protein UUU_06670 [Klebsiella pneumoniae subsp. pneumoniae DSM 30104 = JCM 1662 = NBRC 14940]